MSSYWTKSKTKLIFNKNYISHRSCSQPNIEFAFTPRPPANPKSAKFLQRNLQKSTNERQKVSWKLSIKPSVKTLEEIGPSRIIKYDTLIYYFWAFSCGGEWGWVWCWYAMLCLSFWITYFSILHHNWVTARWFQTAAISLLYFVYVWKPSKMRVEKYNVTFSDVGNDKFISK